MMSQKEFVEVILCERDSEADKRPKRPGSIEGIGFWIDEVSEEVFVKFLISHFDSFCDSREEIQLLNELTNGTKNREEAFVLYEPKGVDVAESWGGAIAAVIYREMGLDIEAWDDYYDEFCEFQNRPAIFVPFKAPWLYNPVTKSLTQAEIEDLLLPYAKELGCEVTMVYEVVEMEA